MISPGGHVKDPESPPSPLPWDERPQAERDAIKQMLQNGMEKWEKSQAEATAAQEAAVKAEAVKDKNDSWLQLLLLVPEENCIEKGVKRTPSVDETVCSSKHRSRRPRSRSRNRNQKSRSQTSRSQKSRSRSRKSFRMRVKKVKCKIINVPT